MAEPNFRALCAELVLQMDAMDDSRHWDDSLYERARAALAQPEPEGVTDFKEELMAAWDKAILLSRTGRLAEYRAWLAHALALVWAVGRRPVIEPVPVDERLPGPEDCDAEGRCWWWDDDDDMWRLHEHRPRLLCWTHWLPHYALPVPGAEVG